MSKEERHACSSGAVQQTTSSAAPTPSVLSALTASGTDRAEKKQTISSIITCVTEYHLLNVFIFFWFRRKRSAKCSSLLQKFELPTQRKKV